MEIEGTEKTEILSHTSEIQKNSISLTISLFAKLNRSESRTLTLLQVT